MAFGKQTDCCDLRGMSCLNHVSQKSEADEICVEAVS